MSESWKPVPGYDMYEVSDQGRVRSWHSAQWGRRKEPRTLKPGLNTGGYPMVVLCAGGRRKTSKVHRLVLEAFVGPCPSGMECCHGDGTRTNNHLSNLRWDTHSANAHDAYVHGAWTPPRIQGEACGSSKLTEAEVDKIRNMYAVGGLTYHALGKQFGVAHSTISNIIHGLTWSQVGAGV